MSLLLLLLHPHTLPLPPPSPLPAPKYSIVAWYNSYSQIKIDFTPAFFPWSNRVNERNHYSCDVIIKKIMQQDKELTLQEAVHMAEWTHNTNVNVLGFTPLQLVTGKSVVMLGVVNEDVATDSLYDDEQVRKIMERHYGMMKEFRGLEFCKKLKKASVTRSKGYEDIIVKDRDLVYYQN